MPVCGNGRRTRTVRVGNERIVADADIRHRNVAAPEDVDRPVRRIYQEDALHGRLRSLSRVMWHSSTNAVDIVGLQYHCCRVVQG